jgi:uncharacterized damage-inducible protein DinB
MKNTAKPGTRTLTQSLIREFEHEAQTTRRHLERLSDDMLNWRPHAKSFTAGALASHIVECLGWADSIFNHDELTMDPGSYAPYQAALVAELLETFDARVAVYRRILAGVADDDLAKPWRLMFRGRVQFERPRTDVFRDLTLSHLIHHRGQFSVYLRLLNVPVPGSYGPSADEQA